MAMQEVKAPEQFKFAKQGDTLRGILASIEPKIVQGKTVNEYMFDLERGDRATCLGLADLEKKIQPRHLGRRMEIRYETDDSSFQKPGQSAMKVFKVLVDDKVADGYEHLQAA
jgi:hypothetical protein